MLLIIDKLKRILVDSPDEMIPMLVADGRIPKQSGTDINGFLLITVLYSLPYQRYTLASAVDAKIGFGNWITERPGD